MLEHTEFRRASSVLVTSSVMVIKTEGDYVFSLLSIISSMLFIKAHGHRGCRFLLEVSRLLPFLA